MGLCCLIFSFLCDVLYITVYPFSFGYCIVLSVFLFFIWLLYCLSFSFSFGYCIVCLSLFHLAIVLSVFQYTASDYPFGIFKPFLPQKAIIAFVFMTKIFNNFIYARYRTFRIVDNIIIEIWIGNTPFSFRS